MKWQQTGGTAEQKVPFQGKLSAANRARLAEIDLNSHDLRHEAGSRKLRSRMAVARRLALARPHQVDDDEKE